MNNQPAQVSRNNLCGINLMKHKINRRDFLSLAGMGALSTLLPLGCGSKASNRKLRHVIIISLDTLRKDHLGCYGNRWIQTPRLDGLADESILFTNYITVVPTTLASHTSLFTGKYPHNHGTPRNGFMVNRENQMLPEILKENGFHTVGIPGAFALDSRFDFDQGFDHYDENFERLVGQMGSFLNERTAKSVTDRVIGYLRQKDLPSNLFLFAHYFDPHAPFVAPEPYGIMYQSNDESLEWLANLPVKNTKYHKPAKALKYAGEISYMDKHIGRLLDYLKQKGILDESILIVTSDHGENFWDHPGFWNHGMTVYQSTAGAVCMVRLPGAGKGGTKVKPLLASVDILPTLLKYMEIDIPEGIDGEAINLDQEKISYPTRIRFCQASKPWQDVEREYQWQNMLKSRCVIDGRYKFIQTPYKRTEELYDLDTDPLENNNLLKGATADISKNAGKLRDQLEKWAQSAHPLETYFEQQQRNETIERLKSLGYIQ